MHFLPPFSMASATLAVVTAVLAMSSFTAVAQPLTVCMAEDNPPLSYAVKGETRGLDVRLAQALAAELQRELRIVPFESKLEGETTLSQEVNALLSSSVCELASGFSLLAGDLGVVKFVLILYSIVKFVLIIYSIVKPVFILYSIVKFVLIL